MAQESLKLYEPGIVVHQAEKHGLPGSRMEWERERLPETDWILQSASETQYYFSGKSPQPFTGFAVGWETVGEELNPHEFHLEIRTRNTGDKWTHWIPARGYLGPDDSPSGLYWSMFYVTPDGDAHTEFEVKMDVPAGSALTYFLVSAADARYDDKPADQRLRSLQDNGPGQPVIISREEWWGNLPEEELEPGYTPVSINISHAMVHHTVTENEPADPAQVIRNIWNWHVYDNGWNDIGYNFLIDHLGHIYMGRYNPDMQVTDVQGAHAGRANSRSVGIGLLGQFHPGASPGSGLPRETALDALTELISWRFNQNQIDPNGQTSIPVNPEGSAVLPNILGHRDVSATACPGDNLYQLLPDVRQRVFESMEDHDDDIAEDRPAPFELHGNYPNPFRSVTTIEFSISQFSRVTIELYTSQGGKVREVFNGFVEPGTHTIELNVSDLASGVYLYRMSAGGFDRVKRMVHIR